MSKNEKTVETITIGALSVKIAEELGVDQGTVSKKLRSRIRNNFDVLAPQWPGLAEAKENRDGNRYPPMPRELADALAEKVRLNVKDEATDEVETDEERKARKAAKKAKKAAKLAKREAAEQDEDNDE